MTADWEQESRTGMRKSGGAEDKNISPLSPRGWGENVGAKQSTAERKGENWEDEPRKTRKGNAKERGGTFGKKKKHTSADTLPL